MGNEHKLSFTAAEVDEKLKKVDVAVDKILYLSDYGIDFTSLFMAGGGSQIIEDVGTFWEDVHATPVEQQLRLPIYFGSTLVMPQSVTRYCDEVDGAMRSDVLQATMTFYFNGQFVTVSMLMGSVEDHGAVIRLAIVSTTDIPAQQI